MRMLIIGFIVGILLGLSKKPEKNVETVRLLWYRNHAAKYCFGDYDKNTTLTFCGAFNALDYVLKESQGQLDTIEF